MIKYILLLCLVFVCFACTVKSLINSVYEQKSVQYPPIETGAVSSDEPTRIESIDEFRRWLSIRLICPELPSGQSRLVVNVSFRVTSDGVVDIVKIADQDKISTAIVKMITDLFACAPKWTPAAKDGRSDDYIYLLPLIFQSM